MSRWTHVCGVVRFDSVRCLSSDGISDEMAPDMGKTVEYGDSEDKWKACTVPKGSEGSLRVSLWTNPDECCLAAYTATVWGDLRDFNNEYEVLEWFNRITNGKMVRQGCFEIEVEGSMPLVFRFDHQLERFVSA